MGIALSYAFLLAIAGGVAAICVAYWLELAEDGESEPEREREAAEPVPEPRPLTRPLRSPSAIVPGTVRRQHLSHITRGSRRPLHPTLTPK